MPKEALHDVETMLNLVHSAIRNMRLNMKSMNGNVTLDKAIKLENRINELRDKLKNAHYQRLEDSAYSAQAGVFFMDYITRLEKIGDHIFNVNEAIAGKKLKTHTDELTR